MATWVNLDDDEVVYCGNRGEYENYNIPPEMVEHPVDVVPVVRCKYCKHRPTGENRDDLEFPDEICPCQCEDFWYNWKPADNWFCGNGERKDGERHEG